MPASGKFPFNKNTKSKTREIKWQKNSKIDLTW